MTEASVTPIVPVQRAPFLLPRPGTYLFTRWIEAKGREIRSKDHTPSLAVVAAIIDPAADDSLTYSARLGSDLQAEAISAAEATPTAVERALAKALQDNGDGDGPSADRAIAALLLLADDGPGASKLAAELIQAFLLSDDSGSAPARDERRSVFADLYRRLVLHQLNNQVRNNAAASLWKLIRRRPTR